MLASPTQQIPIPSSGPKGVRRCLPRDGIPGDPLTAPYPGGGGGLPPLKRNPTGYRAPLRPRPIPASTCPSRDCSSCTARPSRRCERNRSPGVGCSLMELHPHVSPKLPCTKHLCAARDPQFWRPPWVGGGSQAKHQSVTLKKTRQLPPPTPGGGGGSRRPLSDGMIPTLWSSIGSPAIPHLTAGHTSSCPTWVASWGRRGLSQGFGICPRSRSAGVGVERTRNVAQKGK